MLGVCKEGAGGTSASPLRTVCGGCTPSGRLNIESLDMYQGYQ